MPVFLLRCVLVLVLVLQIHSNVMPLVHPAQMSVLNTAATQALPLFLPCYVASASANANQTVTLRGAARSVVRKLGHNFVRLHTGAETWDDFVMQTAENPFL